MLQVAIDISVDRQTVLKPSALLKLQVHPNLNQNVAILRLNMTFLIYYLYCHRKDLPVNNFLNHGPLPKATN